jgi:acyl-CoA synthetase (AMP-forming)/AMP-acid ligase II
VTSTPPAGFWAQATQDPSRTVLIAPDGSPWTAGRLHAAANQLVHGLRAAGLERGDAFAVVLHNSAEFFTAHLAASQAGFYLVPINHHFVAPEIAWIVADGRRPTRRACRRATGTPSARSRASGRTPNSSTDNPSHRPRTVNSAGS